MTLCSTVLTLAYPIGFDAAGGSCGTGAFQGGHRSLFATVAGLGADGYPGRRALR